MVFPGPGATVYRNEEGEVLGWDHNDYTPEYFDCCGVTGRCVCDDDYDEDDGPQDHDYDTTPETDLDQEWLS